MNIEGHQKCNSFREKIKEKKMPKKFCRFRKSAYICNRQIKYWNLTRLNMRPIIVAIACILSLYTSTIKAQTLDGGSNLTVLDMHAGLPHNFVNDIYEDSRGFLWVATYGGGLSRYDGYGFMNLGFGNRNISLRSNSCRNMVEDKFNRLWVSFDEGTDIIDLNTYQKAKVSCKKAELAKILNQGSVTVYRDGKDNVWLLTANRIYRFSFDEMGNISEIYDTQYSSNTPQVTLCDIDSDGTVWLSSDGRMKHFSVQNGKLKDEEVSSQFDAINNAYVTEILKYRGDVWLATNIGLFRYNPMTDTMRRYGKRQEGGVSLDKAFVACLAISNDGQLLVGTLGGLYIYDVVNDRFSSWDISSVVSQRIGDFVHCILVRPGAVWVGTESAGVFRFSSRQLDLRNFVHTSDPSSLSPNCVNATYVEPDGTLWVGTVDGGLNRQKTNSDAFEHFTTANSKLAHNSVSTLAADNQRRLWVGTWGGGVDILMLDNPSEIYHLNVGEKYQNLLNHIGALVFDKRNNGMWIGSNDGMFFYDFDKRQLLLPFERCLDVRGCIGTLIDSRGRLWTGSQTGLRIIDLTQRQAKGYPFKCVNYMYKLDQPSTKVVDKITSFCQSRDGSVWIGSNSYGIYRASENADGELQFKAYTMEDGLPNNSVKGIAEGQHGNLWITTNNGLSVLNPDDETFTNYYEADGFVSSAYYWNSALSDGKCIYLGSDKGLTVVNGSNLIARGNDKLTFTSLAVDNQTVYAGSGYLDQDISVANVLNLHESDKSFAIEFSALQYSSEAKGVYCYRMKGFESQWTRMRPGEHSVRYTNLPSGDYTFEVKFLSAMSGDVLNTATLEIHVSPFFWKSWWFLSLVFVAVVVLATYFYKHRMELMKERETLRLLTPIREALENSDNPMVMQSRIRNILDTQERFKESYSKIAEEDRQRADGKTPTFMERLMKAMEDNYGDSAFDGDRLSEVVGVSRSLLAKKIKNETGQTTTQFVKEYRLNIARELFLQSGGNCNITDIAYRVGFNDPKYFSRCFTKKYGTSPSSFVESVSK